MSDLEGLSINTSPGAYRKSLWAAMAVVAILLLLALVNMYSADENITQKNTTQNQNATETVMCDRYAAVDGSDDAEGTKAAPFNTAQRLVDSLTAGQVGCLRGGVYTDPDKQVVFNDGGKEGDRIVLRSYPGETAEFRGSIHIPEGSNYVTVRNMRLDGSYGPVGKGHFKGDRNTEQAVRMMGNNVNIHSNDVTNRRPNGNPDLAGTCIILGSSKIIAADTSIKGNRIHRCGQMPRINREHGIYASSARGAEISNNFIYSNADRGIQLYPNSKGTLVEGNVVDSNGQNIVFGGSGSNVSSDNTVRNNVISNSRVGWNVSGNWNQTSKVGWDNEVYDNCVWASGREPDYSQNGGISPVEHGFDAYDNLVVEPTYANREAGDFGFGSDDPCGATVIKATYSRELILLSCLFSLSCLFPPTADLASDKRLVIDWLELHDAGGTHPAPPPPSAGTPGIGTGLPRACDVAPNPGLSTFQSALDGVPSSLNGDYVICLHGGAYGNADSVHETKNTGDGASERLIVKSYPGQTAQIRGYLDLSSTDTGVTIRALFFDARFENKSSGTTNQDNPNMEPSIHIAGSDTLFINNHVYGGNDAANVPSGARPMNMRSTCVGYKDNPIRSTVTKNWIHNCGVLGPYTAGKPDAHGLYTSNAANGGIVSDNLIWANAEQGINGYGTSVGPHEVIFEGNVLWGNGRNVSVNGEASGNTVRGNLFLDPLIGNDRNLLGDSKGAPTNVVDNCLDSAIGAANIRESGNVVVSDASMGASGDPRDGTFSLNTTSACLAKYSGTMLR